MEIPREEIEKLMSLQQIRDLTITEYQRNPNNVENLINIGKTNMELAQFFGPHENTELIHDAISKLETAVGLDSSKTEAYYLLGTAQTTLAFQSGEIPTAKTHFEKAVAFLKTAVEKEPSNESYKKSLELAIKGPEYLIDIQSQFATQAQPESTKAPGKKKKSSEFGYDVAGWVILGVVVFVWFGVISQTKPPTAPNSAFR